MKEWFKTFWLLVIFIFIVLALWIVNAIIPLGFVEWLGFSKDDPRAQFGGAFNAVSSLFSGLAFAFLGYTVWQQHKEFQLQRQILEAQQKDLEAQATHLKTQADHFETQIGLIKEQLELAREDQILRRTELEFEKSKFQPRFVIDKDWSQTSFDSNSQTWNYQLTLTNMGTKATVVKIEVNPIPDPPNYLNEHRYDNWEPNIKRTLRIAYPKDKEPENVVFRILYPNFDGQDIQESWKLTKDRETMITTVQKLKE